MKIRPVAALSERRQDTFESHERGLSGRLSARCCCRGREDETELRGDGQYGGKAIWAEEKQNHGIPKK